MKCFDGDATLIRKIRLGTMSDSVVGCFLYFQVDWLKKALQGCHHLARDLLMVRKRSYDSLS